MDSRTEWSLPTSSLEVSNPDWRFTRDWNWNQIAATSNRMIWIALRGFFASPPSMCFCRVQTWLRTPPLWDVFDPFWWMKKGMNRKDFQVREWRHPRYWALTLATLQKENVCHLTSMLDWNRKPDASEPLSKKGRCRKRFLPQTSCSNGKPERLKPFHAQTVRERNRGRPDRSSGSRKEPETWQCVACTISLIPTWQNRFQRRETRVSHCPAQLAA